MRYPTYLLFYHLQLCILSFEPYAEGTEWKKLARYALTGNLLLPVFCTFMESIAEVLKLVLPRTEDSYMVGLDEDGLLLFESQPPERTILQHFPAGYFQ